MATGSAAARREEELQGCQRRLDYLSSRLQSLAIEIGDGQGAVWLKDNMWFLNKRALFFDDVLFAVGKICNHLVAYLVFHKQKLAVNFPFLSFTGIVYEVGEILSIVRDMLLVNPKESLSVKQTQIELFWTDCTPFLFIFDNNNHLLLNSHQIPIYMRAILDLVPTVIQVGLCMYCTADSQLRGFDCFAETCIRLSKALIEGGEFLNLAEELEPVIVPFLRQWILYALELVQSGVKVRTDSFLSVTPTVKTILSERESRQHSGRKAAADDLENTEPKVLTMLSLSTDSSLPDDVAESSLAPLRLHSISSVRASCQPFKWIELANARVVMCAKEHRKSHMEDIGLRENQKLVSDIFLVTGAHPRSWKGITIHCPLTKSYEERDVKLFIKVKMGDTWHSRKGAYEQLFGKGHFLTFSGCELEGFVAVEEWAMVTTEMGTEGGQLRTDYDRDIETSIPDGTMSRRGTVRMMVQPPDRLRERQYRDSCPDMFQHIKSTSNAVEIDSANIDPDGKIAIKIPFDALRDTDTRVLVLKYTDNKLEISDADDYMQTSGRNCFNVSSSPGGTVLATVGQTSMGAGTEANIRNEMEVILGKKQLCKLMVLVEHQQVLSESQVNINNVVFCIVCAESYRVADVLKEKSKIGLIEVPKSQSPDRLLKQGDDITLELKGSVQLDPDIPEDVYTLTYLEGSDNYFRFPVTLTDSNGKITIILRQGANKSPLHTFFCNVQDLLSLIVPGFHPGTHPPSPGVHDEQHHLFDRPAKSTPTTDKETAVIKDVPNLPMQVTSGHGGPVYDILKEHSFSLQRMSTASEISQEDAATALDHQASLDREASLKILNRNSLVCLAKHLNRDEGHLLGMFLGLKQEKVSQIYRTYRHSSSLAAFYVLYEWRGRKLQADQADKLIAAVRDIDRRDLARVVADVRKQNRGLANEDFEGIAPRRQGRR